MADTLLPVEPGISAEEFCAELDLGKKAAPLLQPGQTPDEYFLALRQAKLHQPAIALLANAMHAYLVVDWACQSVRTSPAQTRQQEDAALINGVEVWLKEPTEANRRKVRDAVEEVECETAPAWVATSTVWSGGSLTPDGLPPVPPGPELTPKAASIAIYIVVMEDRTTADQRADELLQLGLDIAKLDPPSEPINLDEEEDEEEDEGKDSSDDDQDKDEAPKIKSLRPEYTKVRAPEPAPAAPMPAPMPIRPKPSPTPAAPQPLRPGRPTPPPPSSPWGKPPADDGGWNPKPL